MNSEIASMSRLIIAILLFSSISACSALDRGAGAGPAHVHYMSLPLADRLGCAHAEGAYFFSNQDYLNEGADQIFRLGMRVIKVFLNNPDHQYPFNSNWPQFHSMAETVQHPYFCKLFDKPFSTFVIVAFSFTDSEHHYYLEGVTEPQATEEQQQFYELAKYLLTTYRGTGKTFILQNWEGDWSIRPSHLLKPSFDPKPTAIRGMIKWMNARQAGVNQARKEITDTDVKIYNACEANLVLQAMKGRLTVVNDVIPHTRCDLYSYSAYDVIGSAIRDPQLDESRQKFRAAMDYFAAKAPDSRAFGDKNIYIGEFGWPSVKSWKNRYVDEEKALRVLRLTVEEATRWGCPLMIYWQVYENEVLTRQRPPTNEQCRGYYLIKPDGTRSYAWDYFESILGK